jgi:hypothetical protein
MNDKTDYQTMAQVFEQMGFPILTLEHIKTYHDDVLKGMLTISRIEMELAAKLEGVNLPDDGFIPMMFGDRTTQAEFAVLLFNVFDNIRSVSAFLFDINGKFINHTAMSD